MIPKNDARSDSIFRGWLQYMYRVLATKVEHYRPTNGEGPGISLRIGEIVYASGDNEVSRAQSEATVAEAAWVGVIDNGGASGAQVSVKTAGRTKVLFKTGEVLGVAQAGTEVYVSDDLGDASLVPGTNVSVIGVLEDGSDYDDTPGPTQNLYGYVYLQNFCGR